MATTTRGELPTRYDAAAVEPDIYTRWMESGAFSPAAEPPPGAERFVITMPPPNITGALHIGHALTATVEDMMIRCAPHAGRPTLWVPGRGPRRHRRAGRAGRNSPRKARRAPRSAVSAIWSGCGQFIDETRGRIGDQQRRLGASLPTGTRERFTMDDGSAEAVRERVQAPVRRRPRPTAASARQLVPALPHAPSPTSRVEHEERRALCGRMRYHLAARTARPIPTTGSRWPPRARRRSSATRRWPCIRTTLATGTSSARRPSCPSSAGACRSSPTSMWIRSSARRGQDHARPRLRTTIEIGQRHGLPMIDVMNEDATMNDEGRPVRRAWTATRRASAEHRRPRGAWASLRRSSRTRWSRPLRALRHGRRAAASRPVVRRCSRWPSGHGSRARGRTTIVPAALRRRSTTTGWRTSTTGASAASCGGATASPSGIAPTAHITVVRREDGPKACAHLRATGDGAEPGPDMLRHLVQQRSLAVQHARLAGRDAGPAQRFYPTTVMETGYDILFFWVARMMMLGIELTERAALPPRLPARHRARREARKMSKTWATCSTRSR